MNVRTIPNTRLSCRAAVFLPALVVPLVLSLANPARAADLPGAFRGDAYATFANVTAGPVAAQLGRSANQPCPCEGTNGQTLSNEIDTLSAGDNGKVLTASVTLSTTHTDKTATSAEVRDGSRIDGLQMLGGLITADTIEAVADVAAGPATMAGSSSGSRFVNLRVGGVPIDANVAQNTVLDLAGVGTVTLYGVTRTGNFKNNGQIKVEMLTVDVAVANNLGLPVGAHVVVAHAVAGYNRKQPSVVVDGSAYAAAGNDKLGPDLQNKIGRAAFVTMGCGGTNGKVHSNSIAAYSVGTVLSVGHGDTTAMSATTSAGTTARTTATVTGASLLGGLVRASTITAVAQQTIAGGVVTTSTDGSGLAGVTVAGIPVSLPVPPNTGLSLPLIGSVVVNEQILPVNPGDKVKVNGVHIKVTLANLLGLPVGSEIILAHADASVAPF